MTVPTNPERLHAPVVLTDEARTPSLTRLIRRRGLLVAGVSAIGLAVVALVLAFPGLAAPIGTAAGVVAAVVPLVQRMGRGGASGGGSTGES